MAWHVVCNRSGRIVTSRRTRPDAEDARVMFGPVLLYHVAYFEPGSAEHKRRTR